LTELKFSEFTLAPELPRGISDAGFTYCTPIQSNALPLALAGRDVAGQAQFVIGFRLQPGNKHPNRNLVP